jgi:N-terminal acetyltransferase B complex non-catalytic subunit
MFVTKKVMPYFGEEYRTKDRSLHLAYMRLSHFTGESMLMNCMEYFRHHSGLPSCFKDICEYAESLDLDDSVTFLEFIHNYKREEISASSVDKVCD